MQHANRFIITQIFQKVVVKHWVQISCILRIYKAEKIRYDEAKEEIQAWKKNIRIYLQKGLIPMYELAAEPHYFERNESHVLI